MNNPTPEKDPKREALLRKIQKLMAMTAENGASENEAAMAAKVLSELIEAHNVSQTELEIRQDAAGCIHGQFTAMAGFDVWTHACFPVAKLFKCKAYSSREGISLDETLSLDSVEINYYGFPQDVEAAKTLARIIYLAISQASHKFMATLPQGKGKAIRKARLDSGESYAIGMAERLRTRVEELIPPVATSSGKGLMVLKDQLVTDEFAKFLKEQGIKLGSGRSMEIKDRGAYGQGFIAGANINLGQSKSVRESGLRIGHSG